MDFERIRTIIKKTMKEDGLSQAKFSRKIKADPSYIGKFFRGESSQLSLKYIVEFCKTYCISMDWLVLDSGQKYLKSKVSDSSTGELDFKISEGEAKDKLIIMLENEIMRLKKENENLKNKKQMSLEHSRAKS